MVKAALTSCVAATAFVASLGLSAEQAPGPAPGAPAAAPAPAAQVGRGGAVRSAEVAIDRRVTFRLRMPNANEVAVQIGGGQAGRRLPMQKDAQGVWSVTTDPMNPDIYTYSLVVDGTTLNDPGNRQVQTSWAGFTSMFVVPGPSPWLPAAGVARGAITRHNFSSAVAGDTRDVWVYTPPGYDARRSRPYPVLYLLHGLGDDAERWMQGGGMAHNIVDNAIAAGTTVPMVMVTTLGYGTSMGAPGGRGGENVTGYSKILMDEVMPLIDRSYNVSRNREERAIAGLSMGGAETLYVGLNNLDKFAWIAAFSSAPQLWPAIAPSNATLLAAPATPPAPAAPGAGRGGGTAALDPALIAKTFPALSSKDNSRIRMLWIVCGTADGLIGVNRNFKDWLRSKNVAFTEQEVPDMAHVWPLWRQNVADLLPKLFQAKGR
jgi:enterochelin esterase-like enzyme